MKHDLIRTSAGATFVALALCFTPAMDAANDSPKRDAELAATSAKSAGASARDIIGQDVRNTAGADLGEVKDLVISPKNGNVAYALVTKGGVLGVGEKIRAVPFSALKSATPHRGALTLDITEAKWVEAPLFRDEELDLLGADRGREVFGYYGQDWDRDMMSKRKADMVQSSSRLMRVSTLIGKEIKNAGQEVGEIEDVIVDLSSRRGSALIDPEDDYVGTNQEYIINFDQLMVSPDRRDTYTTTLTRSDFERAEPARNDWASVMTGYPYAWTGYTYSPGIGYMATGDAGPNSSIARDLNTSDRKMTVADVRAALDHDAELADAARHVTLTQEGRKLVIRGTLASKDLKEKIADRVDELAKGWNVDDETTVKSAAE
jgi:sporulation protein YlmC with PRC-barrel domain